MRWITLLLGCLWCGVPSPAPAFQAGAYAVDIAPTGFPVRVNAMFTERSGDKAVDPLEAKALALEDNGVRLVFCVVDTCMIPRGLIDRAKAQVVQATGIPKSHLLVSATHTHSAPSAMGCLGSRVDPAYAGFLPDRIAQAITGAVQRLQPARVGWGAVDDWEHTFNRRWIRRPDRLLKDPFGEPTVRANMHPGHQSADVVGPSGPVDPQLSLLVVQTMAGRPLAVLANYSQHYYGSPLLSSDYYGRFGRHLAARLQAGPEFVGIMSQGTSGDLMWMNYGAPRREIGYDAYAQEIADRAAMVYRAIAWREEARLRTAERRLELSYRVPSARRLAWAREVAAQLNGRLPQTQPEIYALEAIALQERPRTELTLQALGIGELGIAAIPNEVFALTGLKLKRQSPFTQTFNIELANGAEGYIPPPEQHQLGGYTTWPARTAGLEAQAEPRIVETLLTLLEQISGKPRRPLQDTLGPYGKAVLESGPIAYWRLNDMSIPTARDTTTNRNHATYEDGVALFLPGPDGAHTDESAQPVTPNGFSGDEINRALHVVGGRLRALLPLRQTYSIELWFWNALPDDARAVTGYLVSHGPDGDLDANGDHFGVGGTHRPEAVGRLFFFNGTRRGDMLAGRTRLETRVWHHAVFVRDATRVAIYLDGRAEPEIAGEVASSRGPELSPLFIGGRNDRFAGFEGKVDEVSVYDRALSGAEAAAHFRAARAARP